MQMLQRQIMLKQLQELRRHQQLQELGDGKQQNNLNQLSATNKQASGGQVLPSINGTSIQGFPNGLYSQAQNRDSYPMGFAPQQLEVSLHGTPIASSRDNLNQYSHSQGLSHISASVLTKGSDHQTGKPILQSSDFGNPLLGGENINVSSDQLCMPDGAFPSKQFLNGKNLFGQVPFQGFSSGILPENFQQVNTLQRNGSPQEFDGRQEQAGWPEKFQEKTTQMNPSQNLTTLDPLEQKILFNLDDNSWNAEMDTGGFGSWSALMQSAVAEASSSDTGLQEEWSGLSFQNPELSTDNQLSNFVDSGKEQTGWVDNNVQSAPSLNRKPQLLSNDSNMSSGFPGFHQPGVHFATERREGMLSDSSHESVQQSPKFSAKWLDGNSQQNHPFEKSQPIHTIQPLEHAWPEHSSVHHTMTQDEVRENMWLHGSDSRPLARGNQKSSNQGHLPDMQRDSKASEGVYPKGNFGDNVSASVDRSAGIYGSNLTSRTRENMLDFLHKVDHAKEQRMVAHLSSSDSSPFLEVPEAETPESSKAKSYDQSSMSQHFGLRLAPPSQQMPNTNSFFSFQSSPQSANPSEASPTGPFYLRNQLQRPYPSAHTATQPPEAPLRHPHFNHATSQGTSQPVSFNPFGHQFPVLEAVPVSQPSLTSGLFHNYDKAQNSQQNFESARKAPPVSARDLEAFGRSLKPSNLHPNYSLLHQVQSLDDVNSDPSRRVSDKNHGQQMMLGRDSGIEDPINNGLNASSWLNSFPNRDTKVLSFSSEVADDQSVKVPSLPLLHDTPQDLATHGQSYLQSGSSRDNMEFNRAEDSQINLQMAPSWFKHYGSLKNGQILPMYDAMTAKNTSQQFSIFRPTTATTSVADKLSPPCVLPSDVIDRDSSAMKSKKRKIAPSELLQWHKEVTQSPKRLHTISEAELEWAQAANRLIEKVQEEAEMSENAHPLLRLKKRIVRTTRLMQQVFGPAPPVILSADATGNYDSVAYYAAKLALGDACNLSSFSKSDSCLSSNSHDMISEEPKTSDRNEEHYFSKIVEDFVSRAKKLESDLFGLDKKASIVDIRLEYQELEKFSIINRFAKFHTRGQPNPAETSSSIGTTPTLPKSFPQRYVTAFPMPRAVPEGAQCLSL